MDVDVQYARANSKTPFIDALEEADILSRKRYFFPGHAGGR
jgi:hypothetical protein